MKSSNRAVRILGAATLVAVSSSAAMANGWNHHRHWYPWFGNVADRLPTFLTEVPDNTAIDTFSPGNLWVGSGIPATNMILRENPWAHIELAIKAMYRQGDDIPPTLVDSDGIIHVEVPAGHQVADPAHNVPSTATNRAAWNFTYSYNVGLDGNPLDLDDYDAWLIVDTAPSTDTDYLVLRLARIAATPPSAPGEPDPSGFGWKLGASTPIGDDEGTAQVTQNSQNYAFGYNPAYALADFPPGQFDVVMRIARKHGPILNQLHVIFDVVAP